MRTPTPSRTIRWLERPAIALGYGAVVAALICNPSGRPGGVHQYLLPSLAVMAVVAAAAFMLLPRLSTPSLHRAGEVLVLGVLPLWGLLIDLGLPDCSVSCTTRYRLLAVPEIYGLYLSYGLTVMAYAVARARPEPLTARAEVLLLATLFFGVLLLLPVAVQFGGNLLLGLLLPPIGLPLVAPLLVILLYGAEIRNRVRRHAATAMVDVGSRWHRGLALSPFLLGLHALGHTLWYRDSGAAVHIFTETCNATFSQLYPPSGDCHYLCTVAARGHTRLVRPMRLGRRHGHVIVVNRQLAVANAFEDLLHERWPAFGGAMRRLYDRLGWPLSRVIRSRWAADLVYLAMKPAEWCFYLVLLLFDPRSPEERIDRMYR
jgi:hypothetical protein